MDIRSIINLVEDDEARGFKVVKAPEDVHGHGKKLFLAGSIDMGAAGDWAQRMTGALSDLDVTVLNPRRDDWDNSWRQDITDPQFNEQVTWEMDGMDAADVISYYFEPEGKAPITLMELGLHAASGRCVVCCPEGYWRRGNVQMICDRYDIPLVETLDDLIAEVRERLA